MRIQVFGQGHIADDNYEGKEAAWYTGRKLAPMTYWGDMTDDISETASLGFSYDEGSNEAGSERNSEDDYGTRRIRRGKRQKEDREDGFWKRDTSCLGPSLINWYNFENETPDL